MNVQSLATKTAQQYKIPESIFASLVQHESGWNETAKSPAGALGLTQLMPGTAKSLGVTDPFNPEQNLDGGARYLRQQYDKFGSWRLALAAYNAGPGAVEQYGGIPPYRETRHYVRNIMAAYNPATTTTPAQRQQAPYTGPADTLTPSLQPPPSSSDLTLNPAFNALTRIAQGVRPTQTLSELLAAQPTASATPSTATPQPQRSVPASAGVPSKPTAFKADGDPVPRSFLSSVGGEHPTSGLAGYPAHDYMAPAGAPVIAPVGGTIIRFSGHDPKSGPVSGVHGPFGWSIYLRGNDGRTYFLTHMGSRSVKVGQQVKAGAEIGTVGDYSKFGGANHVHMGVH